jgi:hypothetical protein
MAVMLSSGCGKAPVSFGGTLVVARGAPGEIWLVPPNAGWAPRSVRIDGVGTSESILPTSAGLFSREVWATGSARAGDIVQVDADSGHADEIVDGKVIADDGAWVAQGAKLIGVHNNGLSYYDTTTRQLQHMDIPGVYRDGGIGVTAHGTVVRLKEGRLVLVDIDEQKVVAMIHVPNDSYLIIGGFRDGVIVRFPLRARRDAEAVLLDPMADASRHPITKALTQKPGGPHSMFIDGHGNVWIVWIDERTQTALLQNTDTGEAITVPGCQWFSAGVLIGK